MEVVFQNIVKKYGKFEAVSKLDLTVKSGALHFLLGPSGCGKTTTLRMLAGLETVTSGKILMGGKDATSQSPQERGVGMVFQNYALWPHMTVRKNIEYGLKLRKLSDLEVQKRLDDVIAITQLDRFVDHLPAQLSGGQQQRVALSRALAVRPNVLLLDEPLSNLDAKLRIEMRENITRIHRETGITTIYVTHDQKEALSMGSEVSVMHGGHLLQTATPRELYHNPINAFVAAFIGEANLVGGKITWRNGVAAKVETPLGLFDGALGDQDLSQGDDVMLAMRPEAIQVGFGSGVSEANNSFSATLTDDAYFGESEQFTLSGHGNTRIKATVFQSPNHSLAKGDPVMCGVSPKDVLILKPYELMGQGT